MRRGGDAATSSVRQRVGVEENLLSWFERRHPQVRAAGAPEGVAQVTLRMGTVRWSFCSD